MSPGFTAARENGHGHVPEALRHLTGILAVRHRGDLPATRQRAEQLLALLATTRSDAPPGSARLRAAGLVHAGVAQLWCGQFTEAERTLDEGGRAAREHGLDLAAADAAGHGALLHALLGRLREARVRADEALRPTGWRGRVPYRHAIGGLLALGTVHWQHGNLDEAVRYLDLADPAGVTDPTTGLALALLHARVDQSLGDAAGARARLAAAEQRAQDRPPPPLLRVWHTVACAEQHLLDDRPAAALALLAAVPPPESGPLWAYQRVSAARAYLALDAATRARRLLAPLQRRDAAVGADTRIEAWLLDALAADRLGLVGAVCVALSEAVAAAAAEGVHRPFLAAAAPLAELLDRHRDLVRVGVADADGAPDPGNRNENRNGNGVPGEPPGTSPVEPITEREAVVLRYLPTLLTAREIAAELYVSPNTVKTQLKSIYRKLGVGTRRQAVDRARRLRLI